MNAQRMRGTATDFLKTVREWCSGPLLCIHTHNKEETLLCLHTVELQHAI